MALKIKLVFLSSPPDVWWGPSFSPCSFLCVVLLCVVTLWVPCCATISALKRCSIRLCLHLFVGGLMSYLYLICLLAHSGVQHILCWVLCCRFIWIVHFRMPSRYSLRFFCYCEKGNMLLMIAKRKTRIVTISIWRFVSYP